MPLNRSTRVAFTAGLAFVLTLAVHLWHHIELIQDKLTFLWDGHSYLETCQFATSILMALMRADWSSVSSITSDANFVSHIMNDGAVHTFAAASVFALLGRVPEYSDWLVFVILNASMQALSASLLFVLILAVTGALWWSFAGALMFGLYPSAIVASGRYLTEPYVVLCLLLFIYFATRTSTGLKTLAGVFAGFIVLLKAVLAPSALIAAVVAGGLSSKGKRPLANHRLAQLLAIFAGVFLVLCPWFLYTKSATGTGFFYTPRTANYIACVSLDIGNDGWTTYPQSEFVTSMMSVEDPWSSRLGFISEHVAELTAITVRKIGRFVAHPWNDPRQPIFSILSVKIQDFLHKALLAMCLLGISICLFNNRCNPYKRLRSPNRRFILTGSLIFVAGHFLYLLTQAMGRNNYTMLPFVILFAVLGLRAATSFVARNSKASSGQPGKLAIGVVIVMMVVGFTWVICATETMGLPWGGFEAATIIERGKSLDVAFDVSAVKRSERDNTVFVFVDADESIEQADVIVNGRRLGKGIVPIGRFCAEWYGQGRFLRTHARLLNIPQSRLRQWRAVPVPLSMLKPDGANILKLVNNCSQPIIIYGACLNRAFLPAPLALASDYMVNTADSLDMRVPQRVGSDRSIAGVGATPYAVTFVVAPTTGSTSPSPLKVSLPIAAFPNNALTSQEELSVNSQTAAPRGSLVARMAMPEVKSGTHLNIFVRGKARRLSGDGRFGIKVSLERREGKPILPFGFPDYVTAGRKGDPMEWTSFELSDSIPLSFIEGKIAALLLEVSPVPVSQAEYRTSSNDVLIKDLDVSVSLDDSIVVPRR